MAYSKLYIIKKLLRAFKQGKTAVDACAYAGITFMTFWRWCKAWPRLHQRIEIIKTSRVVLMEDAVFNMGLKGDIIAAKSFLLNKGGWKMGDPKDSRPAVVVQNTVTQNNSPIKKFDDDEELKKNADLIGKFSLVDRYGSKTGESVVPGVCAEGQQRPEGSERTYPSGDPGAHSPVQEA